MIAKRVPKPEDKYMTTPIFVLGWGRSGTTWLSNMLLEHSAIAGIHHEKHWGIHESSFFSVLEGRYGLLDDPASFLEFAQMVAVCDYFRLAGVDLNFLYDLYPASYAEVFRKVMEDYATRLHATYWIEKTPAHTLHAESIARYYPDARFIAIVRNVNAVVVSRLHGLKWCAKEKGRSVSGVRRWLWITIWVMVWQHYDNIIKKMTKKYPERTIMLTYEELSANTDFVMRNVCKFLDLDFKSSMLTSRYPPNSSFRKGSSGVRHKILTPQENRWVRVWQVIVGMMPEIALSSAYSLGAYIYNKRQRSLPRRFFKLLPNIPQTLSQELAKNQYK